MTKNQEPVFRVGPGDIDRPELHEDYDPLYAVSTFELPPTLLPPSDAADSTSAPKSEPHAKTSTAAAKRSNEKEN